MRDLINVKLAGPNANNDNNVMLADLRFYRPPPRGSADSAHLLMSATVTARGGEGISSTCLRTAPPPPVRLTM